MILFQLVLLCLAGKLSLSHRNGAPTTACGFMLPDHNEGVEGVLRSGEKTASPYNFTAELWDNEGRVRVSVTGYFPFKGFLIQGRVHDQGPAVGRFEENPMAQYVNCATDLDYEKFDKFATITHKNPDEKKNLVLFWKPEGKITMNDNVTFYATIVKSYEIFYLKQLSNPVNLSEEPSKKGSERSPTKGSAVSSTYIPLLSSLMPLAFTLLFKSVLM